MKIFQCHASGSKTKIYYRFSGDTQNVLGHESVAINESFIHTENYSLSEISNNK